MKEMLRKWASFFARKKEPEKASPIYFDEDLEFELDTDYAEDHPTETFAETGEAIEAPDLVQSETRKDRDISSETLISFPFAEQGGLRLGKKEASLTVAAANTSLMVFGATGEGKTRSVAIPALRRLHELGCPGLVLDIVKSDYADLCRRFDRALILGPVEDALPVNLIAGWSSLKFKGYLNAHIASYGGVDSFWGTEGVTDAVLVFDFIKEIRQEPPTLADIYDVFNQPVEFVKEVIRSIATTPKSAALGRIVNRVNGAYCMSLFHLGISNGRLRWPMAALGDGGEPLKGGGDDTARQFAWHSSKIMTLLRPFSENEKIKEKLCSKRSAGTDFKSLIYLKNKIIVLDMPSVEYDEAATTVGQLLRMEYRDAIIGARGLGRELGYGRSRFSFTLIDEFQRYATGLGSAHGSSDETSWSDISREYGNINIYLTQSISSLRSSAASSTAVDTLVQNCRNIISLPTCDAPTLAFIDTLSLGDSSAAKKMVDLNPEREAFVYFARGGKNGATLSGVCKTSGSRYSHMSGELLSALLRLPKLWKAPAAVDFFAERSSARSFVAGDAGCLGRVIAITTDQGHDGFIDFESRLLQDGYSIETVFSMPSQGDPKKRLAKALRKYAEQARPGDIVAIVRGGGDRSLMSMFDSDDACRELDALRAKGAYVVMGVGHTKDRFAIEASCDSVRAVPFDAAIAVAAILASRGLLKKARKLSADMRAADLEERGVFSESNGLSETAELSEREAMSFLLDKEDCFGAKEGFEAWRLYAEHCKRHHIADLKAIDELLGYFEGVERNGKPLLSSAQYAMRAYLNAPESFESEELDNRDIRLCSAVMRAPLGLSLMEASCAAVAAHHDSLRAGMEAFRAALGQLMDHEEEEGRDSAVEAQDLLETPSQLDKSLHDEERHQDQGGPIEEAWRASSALRSPLEKERWEKARFEVDRQILKAKAKWGIETALRAAKFQKGKELAFFHAALRESSLAIEAPASFFADPSYSGEGFIVEVEGERFGSGELGSLSMNGGLESFASAFRQALEFDFERDIEACLSWMPADQRSKLDRLLGSLEKIKEAFARRELSLNELLSLLSIANIKVVISEEALRAPSRSSFIFEFDGAVFSEHLAPESVRLQGWLAAGLAFDLSTVKDLKGLVAGELSEKALAAKIFQALVEAHRDARDFKSLFQGLSSFGVQPRLNFTSSGKVSSVSYEYRSVSLSAAQMGPGSTLKSLKEEFDYTDARDGAFLKELSLIE